MMWDVINLEDVVLFVEGKKGNIISYTPSGKVILCKHKIPIGYAKIKSIEDKGNYYLVTAEHVIKDYYYHINYDEFLKILPLHGFKVGFDIPFINDFDNCEEREIFAYNLDNHCIIVANTIDNKTKFNTIDLYCPNMSCFEGWSKLDGFTSGSGTMSIFNLAFRSGYSAEDTLAKFNKHMGTIKETKGIEWHEGDTPHLWNYSDSDYYSNNLWRSTIERILLVDSEVDVIFKNSTRMQEILAKRVA